MGALGLAKVFVPEGLLLPSGLLECLVGLVNVYAFEESSFHSVRRSGILFNY